MLPVALCHYAACCCHTVLLSNNGSVQVPLSEAELQEASKAPEKMAIGIEGGFQVDALKHKVEEEYALVVLPDNVRVPLPAPELPEFVLNIVDAIKVCYCLSRSLCSDCMPLLALLWNKVSRAVHRNFWRHLRSQSMPTSPLL